MKKNKGIVTYPDERLRVECEPVEEVSQQVMEVVKDLEEKLLDAENGVGLAAPQIGENLKIVAIADDHHVHTYINPQIVEHEKKEKTYPQLITQEGDQQDFFEGCLSFPGMFGTVKRWLEIKVKYQAIDENKNLVEKEEDLNGFMAIVFQHEVDHLNGVLFVDHIKEENGQLFKQTNEHLEPVDLDSVLGKEESKS
jgi:peptide deformylase